MKENLEASMNDEAQPVVDDLVDANKVKLQNKENLTNNTQKRKLPQFQSSPKREKESQFNCPDCFFQGTRQMELNKHINLKHKSAGRDDGTLNCRNCGESFSSKWNLMNHRKNKHAETVAYCRNNLEGKCTYADNMCWWSHDKKDIGSNKCYFCSQTFESRMQLMNHRKKEHYQAVQHCNQFRQNNCRFKDTACWFKHEIETESNDDANSSDKDMNEEVSNLVFQKVSENLEPPIKNMNKF